jgi:hypothetical protein
MPAVLTPPRLNKQPFWTGSAPRGQRNPHPIDAARVHEVVWPAHARYMEASVEPFFAAEAAAGGQSRMMRAPAPTADDEVGVHRAPT